MYKTLVTIFLALAFFGTTEYCYSQQTSVVSLNGNDWKLTYWEQPSKPILNPKEIRQVKGKGTIPCTVPGNVEIDLQAAGLIDDPLIGSNVYQTRLWEGHQWCYQKNFKAPALKEGLKAELKFGGIDCLAEIWLNGKHVGSTDNMLIPHTFDVTEILKSGSRNTLQVILQSSTLDGENHHIGAISMGNCPSEESVNLRKAPHTFGWDIMPRLVSAGLWRDVELHICNPVRIRDVNYMTARIEGNKATIFTDIQVTMPFAQYGKARAVIRLYKNGKKAFECSYRIYGPAERITFQVNNCHLWWPKGYGEAALYDATMEVVDENGNILDINKKRLGIRTTRLEMDNIRTTEDSPGRFQFFVNDVPVFVRGTNWVPLDALHSRDRQHLNNAIEMAEDLNCNMIRCWGGNVYEDDAFFDLCDEKGLMVWQDFSMGCTMYPQTRAFSDKVEKEAISVVTRLRNHPSLVVWAGNNEVDCSSHWSMASFNINPNGDVVSRIVLPRVLYEYDPTRPYVPSSPYYSEEIYKAGCNERLLSETHLWGPRGYYKDAYYSEARNAFVSEIGYHGCPSLESLKKMMTPDSVYPWTHDFQWNEEWLTKSVRKFRELGQDNARNNLMINQVRYLFGDVPKKLADFIFASQSVQAEAMKYFIELWRGQKGNGRSGIIWWNLRDGWPLLSDAVVDYYNNKKRAYYYIKNSQHNVCCMLCDSENGCDLSIVNDTRQNSKGDVMVVDVETNKEIYSGKYEVPSNGQILVAHLPLPKDVRGIYLITYSVDGEKYQNHYLYGKPPFDLYRYRELINKTRLYKQM